MIQRIPRALALVGLALSFILGGAPSMAAPSDVAGYWRDAPGRAMPQGVTAPASLRSLDLDFTALSADLLQGGGVGRELSLPLPGGGFASFMLSDSGTMPPELASRYPQIRSFVGNDADGRHARIDVSPLGLNAMVFAGSESWLVRPVEFGTGSAYVSFRRDAIAGAGEPFVCGTHEIREPELFASPAIRTTTGTTRRGYRTAVAANHNYVAAIAGANPPSVALGLAAVTVAMNRVNEVYENDFSVHMTLVPNNDLIIYPDAATDPYSNGSGAINENTPNLNAVIGSANYDIGHVFTTGSGGVAGLGVVCGSGKGRGTTGLSNPASLTSDTFYIDYVAHEMGHQFGGNHTFNNSCGGNRAASAAYEPGSGSTIMAYAGVCSPNLQPHSDPYFHAKSLQEIGNFTNGSGGACSVTTPNNLSPVVAALSGHTIPADTPFALTGSATSVAPGAALTFGWEQYDLGAATVDINVDPGNGPIIRSFNPTPTPTRTVPNFATLLAGTSTIGEILPTTTRTLNFRLTVFDNVAGGGTTESQNLSLQVVNTAGPFTISSPLAGATWNAAISASETVTWNVAGTDAPPVSCASVDIDLYTGTDFDFPVASLAAAVPNSGSALVPVPNLQSGTARVLVRCADNLFFAVSPGNFTVVGSDQLFADGFD